MNSDFSTCLVLSLLTQMRDYYSQSIDSLDWLPRNPNTAQFGKTAEPSLDLGQGSRACQPV